MGILSVILCVGAVWTMDGTDAFFQQLDKLGFKDVSIRASGTVTLAPVLTERAVLTEAAVWQLARDNAGNVYLGTGNEGRLFRLNHGQGKPENVFEAGAGEILAATVSPDGTLFFGTTPGGEVYRLKPGAKPELLFATGESYVFCLLPGPGGTLLCATGDHGRLYSIAPGGTASVIFAAPQAHLTTMAWLAFGKELLVGTSPDGIVYRLEFGRGAALPEVSVLYDTPLDEVRAIAADASGRILIGANPSGSSSDSAGARVYRVREDGVVQWCWACPDSLVFCLAPAPGLSVVTGTGNRGMVYQLDSLGHMSVQHKVGQSQVLSFLPAGSNVWLGTGNVAGLYLSGKGYADSGYIESRPQDCINPARFGRLAYRADVPAGTDLGFDTRTGNSETPDSTWSQWSAVQADIRSPVARFIQWRARFKTAFPGLTPELRHVDVYYRSVNRAPVIRKLDIAELSLDDAGKGAGRPTRQVSWDAVDPDADSIVYELHFRGEGETAWKKLDRDIADAKYELDVRALPDGWYRLKLIASDRIDQPQPDALSTEQTSRPFLVDNTPPLVTDLKVSPAGKEPGTYRATFTVRDALSPIVAGRVSVNAGEWQAAAPVDGILDSPQEQFSIEVKPAQGENTIAAWAADVQGNMAVTRAIVRK